VPTADEPTAGGLPGGGSGEGAGADAVRGALNRARAAARARGLSPGAPASRPSRVRRPRWFADGTRSGARPDARDPQLLGVALGRLIAERGWDAPVAVGGVIGRWNAVVGPDIASHCAPVAFDDGVLTVRADSTTWATQVRLLVPALMRRLAEEVGEGTVTRVCVHGPSGPSWRRGPRSASGGAGPRDTYG
jgi:predicted nucleic acid-binding Zn ribbon protein